jgi:UDP:flavonoid glycosyltransferase YjiC (YdhE family)
MGSTGRLEPFLRNTFATLGRSPYRFIVSTAGRVAGEVLQSAPSNFRLVPFVQGGEILRHCRAMIFHGGNGTMYQALRAGVPMLAVPTHLEQRFNARIAVRNGFCRELSTRRATGEAVLSAIRELVENDSIQHATQHWAQEARLSDGPNQAADLLERFAREGRPAGSDVD